MPILDSIITAILTLLRPFRQSYEDRTGPVFIDIDKMVDGKKVLYLRRWFLWSTKNGAVYLHKICLGDNDAAPHTHPWAWQTRILWRGYNDEYYKVGENYRGLRYRYLAGIERTTFLRSYTRPASHCHQVKLINSKPAWTLVSVGRYDKVRDWGFMIEDGTIVNNETYLGLPKTEKKVYPFDRVSKQGV